MLFNPFNILFCVFGKCIVFDDENEIIIEKEGGEIKKNATKFGKI